MRFGTQSAKYIPRASNISKLVSLFLACIVILDMRQNGNIQVQDPSVSPTYALSQGTSNPSVPASLRRNLFAAHLSRRHVPQHMNPNAEAMSDPFQTQSTASNSQYSQDRHAQAYTNHQSQYSMNSGVHINHVLDPRASPLRPLSPVKGQSTSAGSSIVAIDPATGRPALPVLPTLPALLRVSDDPEEDAMDDGDPEEEGDPDMDYDHAHEAPFRRTRTFEGSTIGQRELDLHSSSLIGTSQPRLYDLIDVEGSAATDGADYDKIESILSEMQSLQKARARTAVFPELLSSLSVEASTNDSRISARTRGKSRANVRGGSLEEDSKSNNTSPNKTRVGGVGATLKQADKNELLGLIMTSLAKRVHEADEDAWMFGDERYTAIASISGSGLGSFVNGRDATGAGD